MRSMTRILAVAVLFAGPFANAVAIWDVMELVYPPIDTMLAVEHEIMTAELDSMDADINAGGRLVHTGWYDTHGNFRQTFTTSVAVLLPNKDLGLETMEDAKAADVRIRIFSEGQDTAECMLTLVDMGWNNVAFFTVELVATGDGVRPRIGVCDVNPARPGITVGVPALFHHDRITSYVQDGARAVAFTRGYCD